MLLCVFLQDWVSWTFLSWQEAKQLIYVCRNSMNNSCSVYVLSKNTEKNAKQYWDRDLCILNKCTSLNFFLDDLHQMMVREKEYQDLPELPTLYYNPKAGEGIERYQSDIGIPFHPWLYDRCVDDVHHEKGLVDSTSSVHVRCERHCSFWRQKPLQCSCGGDAILQLHEFRAVLTGHKKIHHSCLSSFQLKSSFGTDFHKNIHCLA